MIEVGPREKKKEQEQDHLFKNLIIYHVEKDLFYLLD